MIFRAMLILPWLDDFELNYLWDIFKLPDLRPIYPLLAFVLCACSGQLHFHRGIGKFQYMLPHSQCDQKKIAKCL